MTVLVVWLRWLQLRTEWFYTGSGIKVILNKYAAWIFAMAAMVDVVKIFQRIEKFISTNLRLNSI